MKKLLFMLSLVAVVCLFALTVSAVEIDGIDYTFNGTEAYVNNGNKDCAITNVVIPETVTYDGNTYTVTKILTDAFRGNGTVLSIKTPSTIKSIGEHAFREMSALEEITLNASAELTYLSNAEVYQCKALKKADLSGMVGLVDLGAGGTYDHTFTYCSSLTEVYLPDSLEVVGTSVFQGCTSLGEIKLPSSLKTIRGNAFTSCAFVTVEIPEGVTYIGNYAFQSCSKLEEMNIPMGVTFLGCNNFQYTKVTKVIIPAAVVTAGKDMFNSVSGLEVVVLGNADVSDYNGTFFTSCGPLTYVFYAGNDASVLTSKYSAFNNHEVISFEKYLENLKSPEFAGYKGKVLVYGVKTCASCGDVDAAESGFIFDDFLNNMYMGTECSSCGAKSVVETFESVFVDLGYSVANFGGVCSIMQGFKVNFDSIDAYNENVSEVISELGVLAVAEYKVGDVAFDENGKALNGVISYATLARNDFLEIKITGLSADGVLANGTSHLDVGLHLCAYVKVGDKIYYVSDGYVGEKLGNSVKYNDIVE